MGALSQYFELSRQGDTGNVRSMEGLRGFAVFLVFLVHYATLMEPWMPTDSALAGAWAVIHTIGNAGVDLFFVLSGYLIYASLISREQPYGDFMWRRVKRIYPTFIIVFGLYLLLSLALPAESKIPKEDAWLYIAQNLLLLPGLFDIEPIITVAWSLSYEMGYYLVLPLLVAVLGLRGQSSSIRIRLFAVMAICMGVYCATYGGHIRLIMFIAGILLFEALRGKAVAIRPGLVAALVIAALAHTAAPYYGSGSGVAKMLALFAAFFALCYSCFTQPQSALTRSFCWAPLRWLGNMSYSYYLLHGLALKVGIVALAYVAPTSAYPALFTIAMLPVLFVATLLPSAALFLLVERPLSLVKPKRASPAPAVLAKAA